MIVDICVDAFARLGRSSAMLQKRLAVPPTQATIREVTQLCQPVMTKPGGHDHRQNHGQNKTK